MLGYKRKIDQTILEGTYYKAFDNFLSLLNKEKITIETIKYLDLKELRNTNGALQGKLFSSVMGTPNLLVDRLNNIPVESIKTKAGVETEAGGETEAGVETELMDQELLIKIIAKLIEYCKQSGPTLVETGHRDPDQQRETNQADNNTYYTKQLEKLQQAVCKLDILFPNANLGKFIKFISESPGYNPASNPEHFNEWNKYKLRIINRIWNFCGFGGKKKTKRCNKRNTKRLRSKKYRRGRNKLTKRV